ncbi:hypothetical protein [uncultured Gammaproteobacteria bacterium]|nr:hypothetical protein [uncultured Gammaproteobacteria bacterium]CAC9617631.1 hypothetical protein [uncultured Gammaproteobacteria bacterium]
MKTAFKKIKFLSHLCGGKCAGGLHSGGIAFLSHLCGGKYTGMLCWAY